MTLASLKPRTVTGWLIAGLFAVGIALLVADHWARVFGFLPYLIILACPLMHLFMHSGNAGHGHASHKEKGDVGSAN